MVANPLVVVPVDPLIPSIHFFEIFIGKPAAGSNARNHEVVAAKDLLNFFDHVRIQTADRRPHGHHRGNTDDNSDQSEKSPQFVGKNRLYGDPQGVGIKGEEGFHFVNNGRRCLGKRLYDELQPPGFNYQRSVTIV